MPYHVTITHPQEHGRKVFDQVKEVDGVTNLSMVQGPAVIIELDTEDPPSVTELSLVKYVGNVTVEWWSPEN